MVWIKITLLGLGDLHRHGYNNNHVISVRESSSGLKETNTEQRSPHFFHPPNPPPSADFVAIKITFNYFLHCSSCIITSASVGAAVAQEVEQVIH